MTGRIEKTVFISYRRTNLPWALFVYQNLTMHGYDVFFDYQSIDSGNFESVILDNIRARAHFIVILTPSALENCNKPGDWLRREIETAMYENRNIVPLMVENFDFGSPLIKDALSGKLAKLSTYNGLSVPNAYALEAMERLRERYLDKALSDIHTSALQVEAQNITENQKVAASGAAPVTDEQLTAQTWFERGYVYYQNGNFDEAIRCFNEAINLNADFAGAYSFRGQAYAEKGEFDSALEDCNEAIRINPNIPDLYFFRGYVRRDQDDLIGTIEDFTEGIRLQPDDVDGWYERGLAHNQNNNLQSALEDFDKVIYLKSDFTDAYSNRGHVRRANKDLDGALADYNEAIHLSPTEPSAYYFRASLTENRKDYSHAISDYQKYLDLGGGERDGDQKAVERKIETLKSKLAKKKSAKKKIK